MTASVTQVLEQLEQAQRVEGKFKLKKLEHAGIGEAPWLGVDTQGRPILLIPSDKVDSQHEWHGTSLTVEVGPNTTPAQGESALITRCQRPAFREYFISLVQGILGRIEAEPGEDGALLAAREIERWKAFFQAEAPTHLLSVAQLAGLFAELRVLERLHALGTLSAVTAWCGPLGEPKDFALPEGHIEVKATLSAGPLSVEINGLRQLSRVPNDLLLLSVHRLELSPTGDSVPDVVDRLHTAGVSPLELQAKLAGLGCHPAFDAEHRKVKFREVEHRCFDVDDSFPRIAPETVCTNFDALESVNYRVLLGAVEDAPEEHPLAAMVREC